MTNPLCTPILLIICPAIFLLFLQISAATETPPAPPPGFDCFPYLINMSDCLSFVESGSNLSNPEKGCCPELSQVMDTQPICLCRLFTRQAQLGIPLDINRALSMPGACNVSNSTSPATFCAGYGVPVADAAPSEAPSQGIGLGSSAAASKNGSGSGRGAPTNASYLIGLLLTTFLFTYYFF